MAMVFRHEPFRPAVSIWYRMIAPNMQGVKIGAVENFDERNFRAFPLLLFKNRASKG